MSRQFMVLSAVLRILSRRGQCSISAVTLESTLASLFTPRLLVHSPLPLPISPRFVMSLHLRWTIIMSALGIPLLAWYKNTL